MRIAVLGTGYVGLVAGTCFAESGNDVVCADIDPAKIEMLKSGKIPIYEPGLEELIKRNVEEERLKFTTDVPDALRRSLIVFICVGTPPQADGSPDMKYVLEAARSIGKNMDGYRVVVCKSTVPVGTADKVKAVLKETTDHPFDVVSNPEFLKEGAAVEDFLKPDRVVIGCDSAPATAIMKELYEPFVRTGKPIITMDNRSAELTKYAANALLAARISFMNEIANLAERVGADVDQVRQGIGTDARIGPSFLFPGLGYGGSCLEGRETVLVRYRGETRLERLDQLFERLQSSESCAADATSIASVELEVLSWTPEDGPNFLPVSVMTRRRFLGEAIEVRTKLGRRVRCTPDHPFVVSDGENGEPRVKLASELGEHDWLPIALGEARGLEPTAAIAADLLAGSTAAVNGDGDIIVRPRAGTLPDSPSEIARGIESLAHPRGRERSYDIARAGALRLDEARALGISLEGATVGTARNGTYVPTRIVLDEAFWRVVGLYLSEGHCSIDGRRMRLQWSFHPTNEPDLVDEVAGWFRKNDVKVDVGSRTTTMAVSVSSRLLARFFLDTLGVGSGCYDHRIPDQIWTAPPTHKRALLAGLWRGDGSWSLVNGGPSVVLEYGTVSRALADGMLRLLGELGIAARCKVGRTSKSTRDTYWLVIAGADQVERCLDLVRESDRLGISASIALQKKRIKATGYRTAGRTAWVRVAEKKTHHLDGWVYSLEVPGAETFVTTGGLVVHNCFPKDVDALGHTAKEHDYDLKILRATNEVNRAQKRVLFEKAKAYWKGELRGKKCAVWGLAFKPKTDDMREAPSIELIEALLAAGAKVSAYDSAARESARRVFGERIEYAAKPYDALSSADALFVVTEWQEFRRPDFDRMKKLLAKPLIFDGRNIYDGKKLAALGFEYYGIGVRHYPPSGG